MEKLESLLTTVKKEWRAYLVDTSAKVGAYAIPMGFMEAYNGLDIHQIIQSRISVAVADAVLGRVYGKTLNYTRSKFKTEGREGLKNYLVDTGTMLAVYDPAYVGILTLAGASSDQIGKSTLMLSAILAVTARPFSKYVLDNWRIYWKTN